MFAVAIVALVAAQAFDFVSFLFMTARHGLQAEFNPLVVALAENFGLPGLTVAKVGSVLLVGSAFTLLAPRRRKIATAVILLGIGVGVLGGLSNVAST
jgi:hypothetical protein